MVFFFISERFYIWLLGLLKFLHMIQYNEILLKENDDELT